MLLDASGKYASSTSPASVRSSSSKSSKLNWQPSHDANLKTPSFNLCFGLELMVSLQPRLHLWIGKNGSVFADEERSHLAMTTEPNGALHVTLHREIDLAGFETSALERLNDKTHHDFRAAHHGRRALRSEGGEVEKFSDDADMAAP